MPNVNNFLSPYIENIEGGWKKTTEDCLMELPNLCDNFADHEKPIWLLGEGLVYYAHLFAGRRHSIFSIKNTGLHSAEKVHQLGWQMACQNQFADPLKLTPNYLRGPDAVPKKM